ncbi:YjjW family glycine radical enzyme activase [Aliiruegeria lutimaris]|nr:YjjW family glycine radical enzyme activase [Aliiruegeria lutimaris]
MNTPKATVSKLLSFSCVDGPGSRMVLFLQGCNFSCATCHNPHTMALCNDCGDCVAACHAGSLSLVNGHIHFDPAACDQCDECLRVCPIHANPMVQHMDLPEVLERLRRDSVFLDGITVSGGEATVQLKFVTALFKAIKQDQSLAQLTCLIDSNGHLGPAGWKQVLPWTDGVMLDIKAMDPETHMRLTGRNNGKVLESARYLHEAGRLEELRLLVIPGLTDSVAEISALATFIKTLDPATPLRLNAFQHHGVAGPARDWPAADRACVERVAAMLEGAGLSAITKPAVYL